MPGGRLPALTAKVYGAAPPVAVTIWLYAVAATGFGSVTGLSAMAGAGTSIV